MKSRKSSGQPKKRSSSGVKPKRFIVRQVDGRSMVPTLKPDQLVVGRRTDDLRPGDVVIVSHNGLEKIKRVVRQQGNLLYLLGDNSAESTDSRSFGWVQADAVVAKVVWPRLT